MALTPTTPPSDKRAGADDVFMREVDDAVRASDLSTFWKRYGRWLLLLAVLGVAAFGGWIYYQNQQRAAAELQSETFIDAMDKLDAGDEKGAREILAKLGKAEQPGYRVMAQFVEANLDLEKGDVKKAAAAYANIAANDQNPEVFRDLAIIKQTMAEMDDLDPKIVIERLKPYAKPGNSWFGSAGEMTAISYMKQGKENLAGPIFAQIAADENLPQSLRARGTQMAGALGIDAVQLDENKDSAEKTAADDSDKKNQQASENGNAPAKGESK